MYIGLTDNDFVATKHKGKYLLAYQQGEKVSLLTRKEYAILTKLKGKITSFSFLRSLSKLNVSDFPSVIQNLQRKKMVALYKKKQSYKRKIENSEVKNQLLAEFIAAKKFKKSNLGDFHRSIKHAEGHFELYETTVAYLLRNSHLLLEGKNYGQALVKGILPFLREVNKLSILEIGGGLGLVAKDIGNYFGSKKVARYVFGDLTFPFLKRQLLVLRKKRIQSSGVLLQAPYLCFKEGSFDLAVANEMIADLSPLRLNKIDILKGKVKTEGERQALYFIRKYKLQINNAPVYFLFNLEGLKLLLQLHKILKKGGVAFISEYGLRDSYPVASFCGGHTEYSINFSHFIEVAKKIYSRVEFMKLGRFLGCKRVPKIIKRTSLYNLKRLLLFKNKPFPLFAYTPKDLEPYKNEVINLKYCSPYSPESILALDNFYCIILVK